MLLAVEAVLVAVEVVLVVVEVVVVVQEMEEMEAGSSLIIMCRLDGVVVGEGGWSEEGRVVYFRKHAVIRDVEPRRQEQPRAAMQFPGSGI